MGLSHIKDGGGICAPGGIPNATREFRGSAGEENDIGVGNKGRLGDGG